MVNLGLIDKYTLLPQPALILKLHKSQNKAKTILKIDANKTAWLQLFFHPSQPFGEVLFEAISGLNVKHICFDPTVLVSIYKLSLIDALTKWGESIWPSFKKWDGTFFFLVKNYSLEEVFTKWIKKFTHVCFKEKYDLRESKNSTTKINFNNSISLSTTT
ncbi:hypothetical protein SAMN04488516_11215 [Desulfonauticus submarinus]|uniref:Uncharacterized protein n=1 Tax=Desulfonauticus submarinus TaxID=206665 RepID=A0A1H0FEF7_9BACT|nr:hypothetical protein [Desulfonauticus submarinus]SDN93108.1 hypothetical protein SAMN04488516_11215 [Desulfonauticus submarinus]